MHDADAEFEVNGAVTVINNAAINAAGRRWNLCLQFRQRQRFGDLDRTDHGRGDIAERHRGVQRRARQHLRHYGGKRDHQQRQRHPDEQRWDRDDDDQRARRHDPRRDQRHERDIEPAARSRSTTRRRSRTCRVSRAALAVATSGAGNATLSNNAGGVVTGTVSMTGNGSNNFINAGIWNTLGTSTFGNSSVNNTGTINIFGPTTFGGPTSLTNSGTLNLAAGGTIGTLTLPGNLAFQSGALYVVALSPPSSSVVNVGGTASLAGTVQGVLLPGAYAKGDTFTILHAGGGLGGTFSGFINPGFSGTLTYTPSDALLTLTAAKLGAGGGLNVNQQNVATTINNFFNSGGTLPANFAPVFGPTGGNLGNALSQISGEVAADAEHGAFNIMTEFLNLMLDPFVEGRLGGGGGGVGGGQAIGFAPDELSEPAARRRARLCRRAQGATTCSVRAALDHLGNGLWRRQRDQRQFWCRFEQSFGADLWLCSWHGLPLFAGHDLRLRVGGWRHRLGSCHRRYRKE